MPQTPAPPDQNDPRNDPRRDGLYRTILAVLVASVLVGALLTLGGEALFGSEALANVGLAMALLCGGLYWVFRLLGRRAAARQSARWPARHDGRGETD